MFGLDTQRDGSNSFLVSRFLVPSLCEFKGWALFADGDMACTRDVKHIFDLADNSKAVMVVKHDYQTKHKLKYIGSEMECPNVNYKRKNWSSLVLWNCAHPSNAILTQEYIVGASSTHLHRFEWLKEDEIGELPSDWNYLVGESAPASAALYHYTLGVPGIKHYADSYGSWHWHTALLAAMECAGSDPSVMVDRARHRMGEAA